MNYSRREFLKAAGLAGAGVMVLSKVGVNRAYAAAANSQFLRKWIQPLRELGPGGIPTLSSVDDPVFPNTQLYQVTAGEFLDQLHPDMGPTRLWGYWDTTNPVQRHLGGVVITLRGTASRMRFTNALPDRHIIPVDVTLPGADLAQNRIATHLHGGLVPWISDGGPFDWWLPDGTGGLSFLNGPGGVLDNIGTMPMQPGQADFYYPNDQSMRLMWYHDHAHGITRLNAYAGLATGYLILDEVDKGYVDTGKVPPLQSTLPLIWQDKIFVSNTTLLTDPTWATVARPDVQSPGSLWYDHVYNPRDFKLRQGAQFFNAPDPSCIPEFFGDTMLCNGTVYPLLTVEAKRYRFLMLNACNARFLNINVFQANPKNVDAIDLDPKLLFPLNQPGPNMIQIGTEGGFLLTETTHISPKQFNPATLTGNLLLAPAERADVIIDFTGCDGKEYILYNDAPGPFPAGPPTTDYYLGNPGNPIQPTTIRDKVTREKWPTGPDTRQILRIKVVAATSSDPQPAGNILDPTQLDPAPLVPYTTTVAPIPPLSAPNGAYVRDLTLNEDFDVYGRLRQLLGTTAPNLVGKGFGLDYLAPATEVVAEGSTEVWRVWNLTADTHPIHFHLVNVQVLSRQTFKMMGGAFTPTGPARGPEPNELGWKETVQMHPGEVTTVVMKCDLASAPPDVVVPSSPRADAMHDGMGLPPDPSRTYHEFVWHCHILEHEEHDMMRPFVVVSQNA